MTSQDSHVSSSFTLSANQMERLCNGMLEKIQPDLIKISAILDEQGELFFENCAQLIDKTEFPSTVNKIVEVKQLARSKCRVKINEAKLSVMDMYREILFHGQFSQFMGRDNKRSLCTGTEDPMQNNIAQIIRYGNKSRLASIIRCALCDKVREREVKLVFNRIRNTARNNSKSVPDSTTGCCGVNNEGNVRKRVGEKDEVNEVKRMCHVTSSTD